MSRARGLRVGIDARAAVEVPAGRGRYVRELLRALAGLEASHRYLLYARSPWPDASLDERFEWRLVRSRDPLWHLRVAARASRECDVLLSTNSYLTAWFTRTPTVVVVFDMIAFLAGTEGQRRASVIERLTLGPATRRAAALTAISEATARDLASRHPATTAKTEVIPLAADASFAPDGAPVEPVLRRHGVVAPYLLATGMLEPRKNLPRLIEAFASLPAPARGDRKLVLAGEIGWNAEETLAAIARHAPLVRRLGHVPDEDLPALCRGADLFCYPSLYEGFGLPVLEAMACGTPVLTSNRSSIPEVAGDAAFYVDPLDVQDIRRVLAEALGDAKQRRAAGERGLARARLFSWRSTAERTLGLLERVAG